MKKLILSLLLATIVLPVTATTPTLNMKFFGAIAATMAIGPALYSAYHYYLAPVKDPQILQEQIIYSKLSFANSNTQETIAYEGPVNKTVVIMPEQWQNNSKAKKITRIALKAAAALTACAVLPLISAITVDAATHYSDWALSIASGTLNTITGICIAALTHSIYKDIKKMNN